jgi:uncharacterized protein (TIGR02266 family)
MLEIVPTFREFARLDMKRRSDGLSVSELERWARLRRLLDRKLPGAKRPERRSAVRVPTRLICSYATDDELRRAAVTNLASGGMFICTSSPLAIGTALALSIRIEKTAAEIEVEGVVVSNNVGPGLDPGAAGMGVRFSKMSPEVIDALSDLYANEAERGYLAEHCEEATEQGADPASGDTAP